MTPHFKTQLVARLTNPSNGGTWTLEMPLVFASSMGVIVVPGGFETDFASVPRLIVTYAFVGNTAHAAATVHDYLYRTPEEPFTRKDADDVMSEAMVATDIPGWRRGLIYAGVRMGGGGAFKERSVQWTR